MKVEAGDMVLMDTGHVVPVYEVDVARSGMFRTALVRLCHVSPYMVVNEWHDVFCRPEDVVCRTGCFAVEGSAGR